MLSPESVSRVKNMTTNQKNKITEEQLAELLYYFAKKFGAGFVDHEMAKENSPFKKADKEIFAHERLIMIFWIIDKFFCW
jgi:hypothetical protein